MGLGLGLADADQLGGAIPLSSSRWIRLMRVDRVVRPRIKEVQAALSEVIGDGGPPRHIVVRTRASAIDADAWTRQLARLADPRAGKDTDSPEVMGLRIGRRTVAMVVTPLSNADHESSVAP